MGYQKSGGYQPVLGSKVTPREELNIRTHEAAIQVVLVKTRPNTSAELLSLSQAGDVSSRSVLKRTAGPESTLGHANASKAPIVIGKRTADEPPKRMANILIGLTQAIGLERRRLRSPRMEHLGPSGARAEEREGTLGVGVTTNGIQEVTSFDNTALQQGLTPRSGANSSTKQLDVAVRHPNKPLEIMREKFCTDVHAGTTSDL